MFKALIGASIAGLAGAAIWAALIVGLNLEIGYLAWGVGGLVGFGTVVAGGRGNAAAAIAVIVTIISICGGKIVGATYSMHNYIDKEITKEINQAGYEEEKKDAKDFLLLASSNEYPEFMVTHGYTEASSAGEVSQEEVVSFTNDTAPTLRAFSTKYPTFDGWKTERVALVHELIAAQFSVADRLKESLGLMDILFFALGIITALKIVSNPEHQRA